MKLLAIVAIALSVLIIAGVIVANAGFAKAADSSTQQKTASCQSCGGKCTADNNCGLPTCGTANSGKCTCGKK